MSVSEARLNAEMGLRCVEKLNAIASVRRAGGGPVCGFLQHIYEPRGRNLEVVRPAYQLALQVVVHEQREDAYREARSGGQQGFPDPAREDARVYVALKRLNLLECRNHPRNGAEKPQHGGERGNGGESVHALVQRKGFFLSCHLNGFGDLRDGAAEPFETLSQDARNRLVLRFAITKCPFKVSTVDVRAQSYDEGLEVELCRAQGQKAFYKEGYSYDAQDKDRDHYPSPFKEKIGKGQG